MLHPDARLSAAERRQLIAVLNTMADDDADITRHDRVRDETADTTTADATTAPTTTSQASISRSPRG